jgi:hypothetical protein
MNTLESRDIQCPYCGETIEVLIDCSEQEQSYIEDCQVCCRPIEFRLTIGAMGETDLCVFHEND